MQNNENFFEQYKKVQQGINSFEIIENADEEDEVDNTIENKNPVINRPEEKSIEAQSIDFAQDTDDISEALNALSTSLDVEEMTMELPGIKTNIIIKPLKYEEEIKLATNRLSTFDFAKQLNSLILKYTQVNDPIIRKEYFKNQNTFEKKILATDRSLILFGFLVTSFETLANTQMECSKCGKTYTADLDTKNLNLKFEEDITEIDFYNFSYNQSLLNGLIEIEFGINPEWIRLELLKFYDENMIEKNVEEKDSLFSILDQFLLYIKKIKVFKKDKKGKLELIKTFTTKNKNSLLLTRQFLHELPFKVKERISKEIDLEPINKVVPIFEALFVCPYCGNIDKVPFNPEIEFFRKALSLSI